MKNVYSLKENTARKNLLIVTFGNRIKSAIIRINHVCLSGLQTEYFTKIVLILRTYFHVPWVFITTVFFFFFPKGPQIARIFKGISSYCYCRFLLWLKLFFVKNVKTIFVGIRTWIFYKDIRQLSSFWTFIIINLYWVPCKQLLLISKH